MPCHPDLLNEHRRRVCCHRPPHVQPAIHHVLAIVHHRCRRRYYYCRSTTCIVARTVCSTRSSLDDSTSAATTTAELPPSTTSHHRGIVRVGTSKQQDIRPRTPLRLSTATCPQTDPRSQTQGSGRVSPTTTVCLRTARHCTATPTRTAPHCSSARLPFACHRRIPLPPSPRPCAAGLLLDRRTAGPTTIHHPCLRLHSHRRCCCYLSICLLLTTSSPVLHHLQAVSQHRAPSARLCSRTPATAG